jgi:hypothetical protein
MAISPQGRRAVAVNQRDRGPVVPSGMAVDGYGDGGAGAHGSACG